MPSGDSLHGPQVVADSARLLRVVEMLIEEIEKMGLFTVGIYRKPGPAAKVKKLLYSVSTTPGTSFLQHIYVIVYVNISLSFVLFFSTSFSELKAYDC
jgi:hypothetical protein